MIRIHPDGWPVIILVLAVLGIFLSLLGTWVAGPAALIAAYAVLAFRDPVRVTPVDPALAVSPADGLVTRIDRIEPPPELRIGAGEMLHIAILLSPFDVHVVRAPVAAVAIAVTPRAGRHLPAHDPQALTHNRRLSLALLTDTNQFVGVVMMTGLWRRRLVAGISPGDSTPAGARVGLIRFGSRVDVYLPPEARPCVGIGQRMVAGETVLARLDGHGAPGTYQRR